MTGTRGRRGRRWRTRTTLVTIAGLGLVAAGVGAAQAGSGWWGQSRTASATTSSGRPGTTQHHRRPTDRPTASPTPSGAPSTPTPSGTPSAPGPGTPTSPGPAPGTGTQAPALPPANAPVDYQIGGAYAVPAGVRVVSRDHAARPAAGVYNICYVNAFQTQADAASWWKSTHGDLLLRSSGGYVTDSAWDELLLDISTPAKRSALLQVIGPWIDECAAKGFDAVEPDNLDSWTRSGGRLTQQQALAFAELIAARAHGRGLAVAQKNALDLADRGRTEAKLDFAIAEECADYTLDDGTPECQGYVDVYGTHVIVLEYDQPHFTTACAAFGATLSVTRRDVEVSTPGSASYVFGTC